MYFVLHAIDKVLLVAIVVFASDNKLLLVKRDAFERLPWVKVNLDALAVQINATGGKAYLQHLSNFVFAEVQVQPVHVLLLALVNVRGLCPACRHTGVALVALHHQRGQCVVGVIHESVLHQIVRAASVFGLIVVAKLHLGC